MVDYQKDFAMDIARGSKLDKGKSSSKDSWMDCYSGAE